MRLHDLRFGESGLFPDNEGGRAQPSLHRSPGRAGAQRAGRRRHARCPRLAAASASSSCWSRSTTAQTSYLYNAGIDPEAKQASPGVTGAALYFQDRIAAGRRRFDFLRGQERYKYEWGAVDEPIYRVLAGARPAGERAARMNGSGKVVVTELMASGAGGGAQVHVQSLVERLDPLALRRRGDLAVRRTGSQAHPRDGHDSPRRRRAGRCGWRWRASWSCSKRARVDVLHNHMFRAEVIGTRAALTLAEARPAQAVRRQHHPFEPHPQRGRSRPAAQADAVDGSADRGQSGDRGQAGGRRPDARAGRAHLQRRRSPALRRHRGVLHAARGVRLPGGIAAGRASSRGSSRRRATRR